MLKKIAISTVAVLALGQTLLADDYYHFGTWTPDGHPAIDVTGYIDTAGKLGIPNAEYVFFIDGWGGNTAYIYRVDVAGDPSDYVNIADRNFTFISSHVLSNARPQSAEFYVDETGIYYGSGQDIKRWNFDWSNETDIITNGNINSETLAYNKRTKEWWTGIGCCASGYSRDIYKYNKSTDKWEYQFTYPDLGGSHHDGMEIVNDKLYLSDMTSDKILEYNLSKTTGLIIPDTNKTYTYSASPAVEGMGYGPFQHFWIGSGSELYEIGEGNLTTSCTQTFNYTTNWTMQRSKCDNIKVPGFDDTIMAKMQDGELIYATADAGAKAWLESLPCNVTVVDELTLKTGDGFWLVGKNNISKTVSNGESRNNYMSFVNGAYTFVGFNVPVDLNSKFDATKVELIYYYNSGSWNTWTPADGSLTVPANQGLYVLAKDDFSMTIK
jgi:hypothetical protein